MTTVDGNLRGYPTTKVKICKASKDFLENPFLLFCMKINQANTVFQVTKTNLYAPSAGVEIFLILGLNSPYLSLKFRIFLLPLLNAPYEKEAHRVLQDPVFDLFLEENQKYS